MVVNTETSILQRIIEPRKADLTPAAAEFLLRLDFTPADHDRMSELAGKASAGALSADEQRELDSYLHVSDFLAFMQSKARWSLKRQAHDDHNGHG